MEHGTSEHVEEQSDTELITRTAVEEAVLSTPYTDINISMNCVKDELGLLQLVRSEPVSLVKEEVVEDAWLDAWQSLEVTQPEQRAPSLLHRCDKCPKTYKFKSYLNTHYTRAHGTGYHKCAECKQAFKCEEYLTKHIINAHSKKQYQCTDCKKTFRSAHGLHRHGGQCPGISYLDFPQSKEATRPEQRARSGHYRCQNCPRTYKYKSHLITHYTRIHGTGHHECAECNLGFKCEEYLAKHVRNSHSKPQYECADCKETFRSAHALRRHGALCRRFSSPGSREQLYKCDYCQKTFKRKPELRQHVECIHEENIKSEPCKIVHGDSADTHYECAHGPGDHAEGNKCNICMKVFQNEDNFRKHEARGKCSQFTTEKKRAAAGTSAQQRNVVIIKEEPADGELDLGPVVLQHMDCNYRPYKEEPQDEYEG